MAAGQLHRRVTYPPDTWPPLGRVTWGRATGPGAGLGYRAGAGAGPGLLGLAGGRVTYAGL